MSYFPRFLLALLLIEFVLGEDLPDYERCLGSVEIAGHGSAELIATPYTTTTIDADGKIVSPMNSRSYIGSSCDPTRPGHSSDDDTLSPYTNTEYSVLKLLGKSFSWMVDLNELGCKCAVRTRPPLPCLGRSDLIPRFKDSTPHSSQLLFVFREPFTLSTCFTTRNRLKREIITAMHLQ